jgi:hypothetical protein
MSLESKAKEVREYWQNPHNEFIKGKGWNQLVVTLEEGQKLEAALTFSLSQNREYREQIKDMSEDNHDLQCMLDSKNTKIAEANKILDLAEFEDLTGAHKIHWSNWEALRRVLK